MGVHRGTGPFGIAMKDKSTVTIEYHGPPDSHGKRSFTMSWWDENFHTGPSWHGQCFNAVPGPYIGRIRAMGLKVRILGRIA